MVFPDGLHTLIHATLLQTIQLTTKIVACAAGRGQAIRAIYSNSGSHEKNFENVVFEAVWRGKLFKMKV